jgi:menaquinone-dependent protoporphyrinogen oxidase
MSKHLLKSVTKALFIFVAAILLLPCTGAAFMTIAGNDIEMSCQDNSTSGKKVLIVYDTKYGATRTIAYKIRDVLCGQGAQVDLSTVKKIQDVSAYDTVIIGSAIIIEQWRPDALTFLNAQQSVLATKHVAVYITCGLLGEDTDANRAMAQKYYIDSVLAKVPQITLVQAAGLFGGVMDFSVLSPLDLFMIRAFNMMGEGDFRNFDKITKWSNDLYALIK